LATTLSQSARVGVLRRVAVVAAVVVVVLGALTLRVVALARGSGREAADGRITSVARVDSCLDQICVHDESSRRSLCGEVGPERMDALQVGQCAHVEVARGAVVNLERRRCR
jgi:hypothetical protein